MPPPRSSRVQIFALLLLLLAPAAAHASQIVSWYFDPEIHHLSPGLVVPITAVLSNDAASTEGFDTSVIGSLGYQYGSLTHAAGFDVQLAQNDPPYVLLAPAESLTFQFATVTNWKDIAPGSYTIDFATIGGFGVPEAIVASNVFTVVVPEPSWPSLVSAALAAAVAGRISAGGAWSPAPR